MNIPVETSRETSEEKSREHLSSTFAGFSADLFGMSEADYCFNKAIVMLTNIKLVYGGTEVSYTLRKRKILKDFLRKYIKENYGPRFDDLEETIAGLE